MRLRSAAVLWMLHPIPRIRVVSNPLAISRKHQPQQIGLGLGTQLAVSADHVTLPVLTTHAFGTVSELAISTLYPSIQPIKIVARKDQAPGPSARRRTIARPRRRDAGTPSASAASNQRNLAFGIVSKEPRTKWRKSSRGFHAITSQQLVLPTLASIRASNARAVRGDGFSSLGSQVEITFPGRYSQPAVQPSSSMRLTTCNSGKGHSGGPTTGLPRVSSGERPAYSRKYNQRSRIETCWPPSRSSKWMCGKTARSASSPG